MNPQGYISSVSPTSETLLHIRFKKINMGNTRPLSRMLNEQSNDNSSCNQLFSWISYLGNVNCCRFPKHYKKMEALKEGNVEGPIAQYAISVVIISINHFEKHL